MGFIKKNFVKTESDTPERTLGSLVETKPEVIPEYITGMASLKEADVKFFNRDVIGAPAMWMINTRAAIRHFGAIFAFLLLAALGIVTVTGNLDKFKYVPGALETLTGIRVSCEAIISRWFGNSISLSK